MLGRLPWFALERRMRALRFLVFLDMGIKGSGRPPLVGTDFLRLLTPACAIARIRGAAHIGFCTHVRTPVVYACGAFWRAK